MGRTRSEKLWGVPVPSCLNCQRCEVSYGASSGGYPFGDPHAWPATRPAVISILCEMLRVHAPAAAMTSITLIVQSVVVFLHGWMKHISVKN